MQRINRESGTWSCNDWSEENVIDLILSGLFGRKIMEWFNQKTLIAGIEVSNWMIALGAIIVILLAYSFTH